MHKSAAPTQLISLGENAEGLGMLASTTRRGGAEETASPKEPPEAVMEEPLPDSLELQRKRMRPRPAQGSGENMIMTAGFAGLAEETGDDMML